ncbi:MarR family transcriptional regulator [uncultured Sulfitobacter sp.]|uniref:GbsR/MarR family transcriptional regulator n=1 Tax=uncultured Sulfitobacter sp. TaxID=191468 RepID=UPI00261D39A3|nr:MarR family transcriptional regulator [uncultured Sulfitobacter sp.]
MSNDITYDAVRTDFIEKTGLITQAEGLPRIAGRVFGMLIFDGEVVSFGDLATKLQVSRASISTSIRILEERGLVKRVTKPGERQDFFQLAPNPYATMLERIHKRNRSIQADIAETIRSLPANSEALGRLNAHANFYASLDAAVAVALSELDTSRNTSAMLQPTAPKDYADDA